MLGYVKTISEQQATEVEADLPSSGSTPSDQQGTEQEEQPAAEGEKGKVDLSTQSKYAWQVYVLALYYVAFFLFLFWSLIDVWSGQLRILKFIITDLPSENTMDRSMLIEISFALLGGFGGSIEYHIKALYDHYTRGKYNPNHFIKYLTAPFEGAALAVIVLSLIRGGITMLSGPPDSGKGTPTVTAFAALSIGALVGFGMRAVVSWLLGLVQTMFGRESEADLQPK
jgi:hypothetical protein